MFNRFFFSGAFVCALLAGTALWGQTTTGEITGEVTDSSGAKVAGARLSATSLETGAVMNTVSNGDGVYHLNPLPNGTYKVTAEREGFDTFVENNVILNAASVMRIDVSLRVGGVTQAVEVTAASPLLISETATDSSVINNTAVENLPLEINGKMRDPMDLLKLTPGYSAGTNVFSLAIGAISGGRGYSEETLLDGNPVQAYTNSLSVSLGRMPIDGIQEIKVITSGLPAEYGRTDTGILTMVSKSGTRDLHGGGDWLIRNDDFDARPYFAKTKSRIRQDEFGVFLGGPVYIPKIYEKRDKTFFFFDFNRFLLYSQATGQIRTVPTALMRNGNFSEYPNTIFDPLTDAPDGNGGFTRMPFAGNIILQGRLDPVALQIQNLYPLPNAPGVVNNLVGTDHSQDSLYYLQIKIDHYITQNNRLVFQLRDRHDLPGDYGVMGFALDGSGFAPNITRQWLLSDDHILSPTLLNHFQFGLSRALLSSYSSNGQCLGITIPGTFGCGRPATVFTNVYSGTNVNSTGPTTYYTQLHNNWNWQDSVTKTLGTHSIKIGFRLSRNGLNERPSLGPNLPCWNCIGSYQFSNLETGLPDAANSGKYGNSWASMLLGQVDSASANQYEGLGFRSHYFALYVQDDFKVTPKLTINYGLRWDYTPPFFEVAGRYVDINLTEPNPSAGGFLGTPTYYGTGPGRAGRNDYVSTDMKEFGPRLGVAYQLDKNTVFRAGATIAWAPQQFQDAVQNPLKQAGFSSSAFAQSNNNGLTPAFILSQGFSPSNITYGLGLGGTCAANMTKDSCNPAIDNGLNAVYIDSGRNGVTYQYTATIQRMLPGKVSVDASYVGTIGKHLNNATEDYPNQLPLSDLKYGSLLFQNINSAAAAAAGIYAPYAGFKGTVGQALRQYPQFLNLYNPTASDGNSNYQALQIRVEKNMSHGFQVVSAYSFSKTLTDVDLYQFDNVYNQDINQYNRKLDKGLSTYDTPNRLVNMIVWELPVGRGQRFLSSGVLAQIVGGWSISAVMTYNSGYPLNFFAPNNLGIFNGINTDNLVAGQPALLPYNPQTNQYLNKAAFAVPAPFTLGTLGRVTNIRTFGFKDEDVTVYKKFTIRERFKFQLGFSAFNVFNRHNLGAPITDITNPSFGVINTTLNNPRNGQASIKILF